jgi:Xaa-Pro aminopeptidase
MSTRLDKLRRVLQEQELDAILVTRPENQRYLSGFTGGEGALLITPQQALLLTDFRYYEQVAEEAPEFQLVKVVGKVSTVLKNTLREVGAKSLVFESTHLTHSLHQEWRRATRGTRWVPTTDIVETMRLIKDSAELANIREAVAIADKACDHIRGYIKPGMTETQVAWELEAYVRTHGAEAVAFPFIVGSGPNGAKPHAVVGERKIKPGEPIVIDMGARVAGYHSDVTRTICVGEPDDRLPGIYDIVLRAQLAAEQQVRPGVLGSDVDAAARNIIKEAGYGKEFGHGLGHGVGLAVHEEPRFNADSRTVLEPGMVVTVEPGIYLPGWGGVRIEDIVVVTEEGVEVLTSARKQVVAG